MKELFIKYVNRECSEEEVQQIVSYFQNADDFSDVPTIEDIYQLLEKYPDIEDASAERIRLNIRAIIREEQKAPIKKKMPYWKYTAAAIVIGVMATVFIYKGNIFNNTTENSTPVIVSTIIKPGTDKATLTLADGTQVALEKGSTLKTQNATSNGEKIIYKNQKQSSKEIAYNILTIPRGGQFFIKLSDGTSVWLNSESQLKYPMDFIEGQTRKVELIYGEAYFAVSHSTEHKGSHFKVFNNKQEVEVLGTEFNIKAYKDETNIYTTLVKGKVSVSTSLANQIMSPNEQSKFNLKTGNIKISNVDVYNEIAWKEGVFSFDDASLKEIMKVLSRWYNIEVIFENKNIENQEFIGVLRKDQNVEKIISTIKAYGIIKEYEFKNKTLILK